VEVFAKILSAFEAEGEPGRLELADAVESPAGGDQVFEERLLGGALGLVFVFEGLTELVEIGWILGEGEDDFGGGEAVLEGVVAHGGASFGGDGPSALEGVAAIGR